jgi:lipoprotein NlpD
MNNKFFQFTKIASCLTLALLVGCARTTPPAEVEFDQTLSPYHVVGRGESISSIAQRHHMNKMDLIKLNALKPPYKIVVGQKLLVHQTTLFAGGKSLDPFDAPASEPEMKGDVKVAQLAPLPGEEARVAPEAEHMKEGNQQPFARPDGTVDDEPVTTMGEETKPAKMASLPETPHAASSYLIPVKGRVIRGYKPGKSGHDGVNIAAPKGTPVIAANNGVVAHAGNQVRGFGNLILIRHEGGIKTVYAHLDEVRVKVGDKVQAGQKIGTVGKSGNVKEPQLHFEIRKGTTPVDPTKYIPLS